MSKRKVKTIQKDLMALIEEFANYKIKIEGKTESSIDIYKRNILEFCNTMKIFDKDAFINVSAQTIKDWLIKLDEKKNAETTRNNKLTSIKQIFVYLEDELDVEVDRKIQKIKYAKAPIKESRYVSETDFQDLLQNATSLEMRAAMSVLFTTGVRFSELLQITCSDIERGYAKIMGKGRKERTIWFQPTAIKECKTFINFDRKKIVERLGLNTDLLFISRGGLPIAQPVFLRSLKRIARKKGLYWYNEMSPHKFRHGYATAKLNEGYPVHLLRDSLGHASINTTNRYVHSTEDAIKDMMIKEQQKNDNL